MSQSGGPLQKNEGSADNGSAVSVSPAAPSREEIVAQLDRILNSAYFRTSRRSSIFLQYVVDQVCQNRVEHLKERMIGVEVFSRPPDYDTNQDPIVRSAAGEVRKRLAQYYLEPGNNDQLRVTLPPGFYVPEFHPPEASEPTSAPPNEKTTSAPASKPKNVLWLTIGAATVAVAWLAFVLSAHHSPPVTVLDQFWAPMIERGEPVMLCVGQPRAYNFQRNTQRAVEDWFLSGSGSSTADPATLRGKSVPASEIVPMWDRYIAFTDAQAMMHFARLFFERHRVFEFRGGKTTSLRDLRGRPVVLVGAFDNEWTLNLTGDLRFYFDTDNAHNIEFVRDRKNPQTVWRIENAWPYWRMPMDYAIVSRVFNATTEQMVVTAAGITQYGTASASELLTNDAYLSQALKSAPPGWQHMNMEAVLATKVIGGNTGPPEILAVHFW